MIISVQRQKVDPELLRMTAKLFTPQIADILKEIRELKKTLPEE
jgi:hypothetical protein